MCTWTRAPSSFHSTRGLAERARARSRGPSAGLREHRLDRPEQRQPERREPLAALGQRGGGDGAQVAREHQPRAGPRRPGRRPPARRLDHHALERALPQLAGEEPREELLLRPRRAGEKAGELLAPRRLRARPGRRSDLAQRRVHLEHGRARAARPAREDDRAAPPSRRRSARAAARPRDTRRRWGSRRAAAARARLPAPRSSSGGRAFRRPRPRPRRARSAARPGLWRPTACYCSLACVFYQ